jgi:hypothetical protein
MDVDEHSTAKLALKGGSALSIVLAGIAAANAGYMAYEEREKAEEEAGHHFPANYFEEAAKRENDLYFNLMNAVPYLPATDLIEAAAQIGQAINVISMAFDDLPNTDDAERPFKEMEKKVNRLLHSALRVLETHGSFSLVEMGLESLRNPHRDPWAETEGLVANLLQAAAK